MVAPVNEFDITLQAEAKRTLAPRGGIILSTTANVVTVASGVGTPGVITLVATPLVVSGTVTWQTSPTVPYSLDPSGLIMTLLFSNMGAGSVTVTATLSSNGLTYTDKRVISQVSIGSLGYQGALDATRNTSAQGPIASRPAGASGDIYFATDVLKLYQNVGGTWQEAGNNFTNTSQLTDGAGLGQTATWANVSGTGKPVDGATKNTITSSGTPPASPANGDIWVNTTIPVTINTRVAGAWVAGGNIPTSLSQVDSTASSKLSGVAVGATANVVSTGTLAARPAGADGDFYFATDTATLYQKVSGSWVASANNFTNTSQLTDGAGLGQTAIWTGVSGTGKPADNATANAVSQGVFSGRPAGSNGDFYLATDTGVLYQKVGGSWVAGATSNFVAQGPILGRPGGNNGDLYFATDTLVLYQKVGSSWVAASTVGAKAGTNLTDSAGTVLGDTAIKNTLITVNADGSLNNAGGGNVTPAGIGIHNYLVAASGSSYTGTGLAAGVYVDGSGTNSAAPGRSYTLVVIDRVTGLITGTPTTYDVYTSTANATALANALNALDSTKIVIVFTYDEPSSGRFANGLPAAMYRCGASRAVFGSNNFSYRSAYILVGIPGVGEGNGAEAYQGVAAGYDTNAWAELGFTVSKGNLTGVSALYTPLALTDYGYIGDLNATAGATLGTNVGGQITSNSPLIAAGAIGSTQISDLRTTNYAEDASGNPTAGAKMASAGTALKVAKNSFQVGTLLLSDYWYRLVQGIDGSVTSNRIIWRGNNDATTRGGAPDIGCLSVVATYTAALTTSSYTNQLVSHKFSLTPSSYSANSDNLDAMQQIHVQFFNSTGASAPVSEFYQACPSRPYDGASGIVRGSWVWVWRLNSANDYSESYYGFYNGYLRIRIGNTYGWSNWQDFGQPIQSNGLNATLPYATITGCPQPVWTGGSGSQGGACPAPWVKVRLLNGKEISASDLHNGACLAAVNDTTMQPIPKGGIVRDLNTIWAQRYRVKLTDGTATEWSENHRFAVAERGWVQVQNLRGGDQILGLKENIVDSVFAVGEGQVVSFRVDGAGTYFAGGLLCHNTKASF